MAEDNVIELDSHFKMTPTQVLEKCKRKGFDKCIVIGMKEDENIQAVVTNLDVFPVEEIHFVLAKVADAVLGWK